jgi:hypothetical protein
MASKECVVDLTRSSKVPSSAPLQVFPRMTAKLVPKILGYNLHVLEDEDIINQVVGKRNFGGHLHQWEPWLARRGTTRFLSCSFLPFILYFLSSPLLLNTHASQLVVFLILKFGILLWVIVHGLVCNKDSELFGVRVSFRV